MLASPAPIVAKVHVKALTTGIAKYDPLAHPGKTSNTMIAAFAALSVLAASGVGAVGSASASMGGLQQGFLAQLGRANILGISAALGRGDKSRSWKSPLTSRLDGLFTRWANRVSGFSPLFANVLADANYLRAMVGSISIITYPVAAVIGFAASASVHHHALPPTIFLLIATMLLGVLDAFAGLIAYSIFVLSILFGTEH